jgi:DnaJ-class molecular chaperone
MDAIIMPSTTSILPDLKSKYPQFKFEPGDNFAWSSSDNVIFYDEKSPDLSFLLLHELSHALLGHEKYNQDIELIAIERKAWDKTAEMALDFRLKLPDSLVQSTMDSYRDWLHARSSCPKCHSTGLQTSKNGYNCPVCNNSWQVNEAKTCALRRYQTKKRT